MERVLVLGASQYDFTGGDGRHAEGANVFVVSRHPEEDPDRAGHLPVKLKCSKRVFAVLDRVPCIADIETSMRPDSKGAPVLTVVNAELVMPVPLADIWRQAEAKLAGAVKP